MSKIPDARIPDCLQSTLEGVLVSDSMGIRFQNEKKFRKYSVLDIEKIFRCLDADGKKTILLFLREAARSLYIMPAYIPSSLKKIPPIDSSLVEKVHFQRALDLISQNELALPAFSLAGTDPLKNLFDVWLHTFSIQYRGPLFFYKNGVLEKHDRQMGILNSTPSETEILDPRKIETEIEVLKSLQWTRNRMLSLTEPWMYSGIFY